MKKLPHNFYDRPTEQVAEELLGKFLIHKVEGVNYMGKIVEVEAYLGPHDLASHTSCGVTKRNRVMFGPPGFAYVYLIYGMHFCVNLVCLPQGTASAVLLRAGRVTDGVALAAARRMAGRNGARQVAENDLARGPARLCQALGIDRSLDGADVCDPASELRILPSVLAGSGQEVPRISQGPRVGISVAADRPWRFWLTGDPTVSPYRPHLPRTRPKPVSPPAAGDDTIHR